MAWSIMSPVGSNMRPGSSVLRTNAVSTTSEGDVVDAPPPPLPLLPQAARLAVTATTQPETSNRYIRIGHSPIVARRPQPADTRRLGLGREANRQTFPLTCASGQG